METLLSTLSQHQIVKFCNLQLLFFHTTSLTRVLVSSFAFLIGNSQRITYCLKGVVFHKNSTAGGLFQPALVCMMWHFGLHLTSVSCAILSTIP